MLGNRVVLISTVFVAGAAAGWLAKPDAPAAVSGPARVAERDRTARPGREASPQAKVARMWMDRIETGGVREVAKDVPPGDFKALVEGVIATVWGGMSDKQLEQLMVLIADWAGKDLDGALAWARSLENPKQREVGLIGIAAKLAKDDPKAAFEIYAELEEVSTNAGNSLSEMMRKLYNDAAKQGVEAVLDLARRTPQNRTNISEGIGIEYPPDFDFRALIDGLIKTTELGGISELLKPFAPNHPFGSWADRDADAAFEYIVDGTAQGQFLRWSDIPYELGKKWGTMEVDRWMGAKLAALSPAEQKALLSKSDLTHSPGTLRKYITNMPTEEAAAEFRFQYMDRTKEFLQVSLEVLNDVPEVQDRVVAIERLRGVTDDRPLRHYLSNLNLAADRIDQIVRTVSQPVKE